MLNSKILSFKDKSRISIEIQQSPSFLENYFRQNKSYTLLKQGIWAYILLLIFEGALRKWIFPSLATPLLIVRDPLAIWMLVVSYRNNLLPRNIYIQVMVLLGVLSFFLALFIGHGNIFVALYGARIFIFHFPLMFVIGRVLNQNDIIKVGKFFVYLVIPMTILIGLQFYSPQYSWVNRGVGGDIRGAGFGGALGYFRPPGTFSFANGNTLFFGCAACFIFYFWLQSNIINRLVHTISTLCLLIAIPLSISRSLFFFVIICLIFFFLAVIKKPRFARHLLLVFVTAIIGIFFLSKTSVYETSTKVFANRFETANEVEGGLQGVLGDRYLGGMLNPLFQSVNQPFFGYGIGMGSNVGSMLLSGKSTFLLAEEEWGKLIGELGPLIGILVILVRLFLSAKLTILSYRKLINGEVLPWMLLSFGLLQIPQGQWTQPTALGYSILIGGFIVASLKGKANLQNKTII